MRSDDLVDWTASGELKLRIDKVLPLSEGAEAHRLLESRNYGEGRSRSVDEGFWFKAAAIRVSNARDWPS